MVLALVSPGWLFAQDEATRASIRVEQHFDREDLAGAARMLDSLRPTSGTDDHMRLVVACTDARLLWYKGEALEGYDQLDSVATLAENAPDRLKLVFLITRARLLADLALNDEARRDVGTAIDLARKAREPQLLAAAIIAHAQLDKRSGDYDDMLAHLIEADKLCDSIHYARGQCNVLINWGNMFYTQQRHKEAMEKYQAAYQCAMAHHFPSVARNAVQNIGSATYYARGASAAIEVYESALEQNKELGDRAFEADVLRCMAIMYNDSGLYDRARVQLNAAMGIVRELGDTSQQVYNYNVLATSYWKQGLRDSALTAIRTTVALSHAMRSLELESDAEVKLYSYLKEMGREAEALEHFERHITLDDSLDAIKEGELINRLEIGYETEKKERTIEVQRLRLEQESARTQAREVQRNILLGTLAALVIVGFLIFRNVSHKRTLAEQQKQLSEQRVEQILTEQELRLVNATMEGQDKERQRVAKDLHDRVGSLLSGVKLQFSALEDRLSKVVANGPEQFKKVLDLVDTAVGEVRRISHDLLSSNLAAFGLNAALTDLCDAVHVPGKMDVELSLFGVEERMARNVEVAAYRIVQEVVSNTLKHAQATTLTIQVTRTNDQLNILVEDNGRGFDPATVAQGMGTGNLHSRAAELGGKVNIDSRPGRGTSVSVDIPLA